MYFLLEMGMFHCYVRLPEGNQERLTGRIPFPIFAEYFHMEPDDDFENADPWEVHVKVQCSFLGVYILVSLLKGMISNDLRRVGRHQKRTFSPINIIRP